MKGYKVRVWHLKKDIVDTFVIPYFDAISPGTEKPNRTVAGIRAREQCAHKHGEDYDSFVHKVLSVEEV